jgi:hypothetical protein
MSRILLMSNDLDNLWIGKIDSILDPRNDVFNPKDTGFTSSWKIETLLNSRWDRFDYIIYTLVIDESNEVDTSLKKYIMWDSKFKSDNIIVGLVNGRDTDIYNNPLVRNILKNKIPIKYTLNELTISLEGILGYHMTS